VDDALDRTGPASGSWVSWALLAVGVGAASVSAILIRYAGDAHPLAISFWRCAAGAVVLLPFAKFSGISARELRVSLVSGIFLALHFATWITSLELTTVAASVLLVTTTPIWVGLAERLIFGERLSAGAWSGIVISFVGAALIAGGDLSGSNLLGNVLALIGGATVAGYVLAGRDARRSLGIIEYSVLTYAAAAAMLLLACIAGDASLGGYPAQTWWALAGIVVGPQLLGHTVINFVLKDIDATIISVSIMAEPLIATFLAYVLFSETPSLLVYPGGLAVLVGIYLVTVGRRATPVVMQ
jgi:drug/metabolite transporter (DMT)-like permease